MGEFKREHRYWVFKRKNLLNQKQDDQLRELAEIHSHESDQFRSACPTCVVVEDDWPEYELVWDMIQARIEGRPNRITELEAEVERLREEVERHERVTGFTVSAQQETRDAAVEIIKEKRELEAQLRSGTTAITLMQDTIDEQKAEVERLKGVVAVQAQEIERLEEVAYEGAALEGKE